MPGALVWAAGMAYFATQLGVQPDFLGEWLPGMVILGIGAGLTFPTLSGAAVGSVPGPRFAVATSLNSVARQLGAALGVAILIAILGNPSRCRALRAFEHGWLFAGACFLLGSTVVPGLVVTRPSTRGASPTRPRESQICADVGRGRAVADAACPGCRTQTASTPSSHSNRSPSSCATCRSSRRFSETMRAEIAELASAVSLKRASGCFAKTIPPTASMSCVSASSR